MRKLVALALALVAAFVFAPGPLAAVGPGHGLGDPQRLGTALRGAFAGSWSAGRRSPELARVVDYWLRYHLVKAVIAALLLAALVAIALRLRHWAAASVVAGAGLLALATVMANVQGAIAPFSSLLPMLLEGPDAEHGVLAQVRRELAAGGTGRPLLRSMVGDFARYHEAMAVIAALVAIGLVTVSVVLWRRFAATRAAVSAALGAVTALASLAALVIVVANTSTANDPAPALAALFDGGW
ncbi:hypothetical protein [Dactylosporangium sp. NPDC049140]|uniref:hypothetical protein n=1 Tax=Dactylosporangium sp. NPDC049140 TaxID=3155647 RepID=UPI0033D6C777